MRVPFEEITAKPDTHSNVELFTSEALLSLRIVDTSNCRYANSPRITKSESCTTGVEPIKHDFCTIKISADTSFTGTTGVTSISRSLSSSDMGVRLAFGREVLFCFLTRLIAVERVELESERGGVLALRFGVRLNFRTVSLAMFWGRKCGTVKKGEVD